MVAKYKLIKTSSALEGK